MSITMVLSDPFVEDLANSANNEMEPNPNSQRQIRRPYHGLLHGEEYFAYLSVKSTISPDGNPTKPQNVSIIDSSSPNGASHHNHNFMLTQVDFAFQEKTQIIETFGSDYAFFFGQKPVVINCSGFLLNSRDFNWYSEWLYNYQTYLRGTACVKSKSRVYLGFKNNIAIGYLLSTNVSINASQENVMGFNFVMLLTNFVDYSRFRERVINDDDDIGYTVNSNTGGREIEFIKGSPDAGRDNYSYVDFINQQVKLTHNSDKIMPSIDSLSSTWWLPDSSPLPAQDAFKELSISQYMEENSVSREEARLASLRGELLSDSPANMKAVQNVFDRTVENGVIVQ